ncbi:MAG: hypothetical protein IJE07_06425 [Clostridia bacterium]|nr:hypothetical protein [Clostridia bacterium]
MRNMIWRQVRFFLVLLGGYLAQACIMPYLQVGSVTPSMLVVTIAVITVGYGRLRAFWAGAFYGIVTETFLASVPMFNLMLYPVCALLCSVPCADKSAARLQYERSIGKVGRNRSPLLRTVICAVLNGVCIEVVNLVYMYLNDAALTASAVGRALLCIGSTAALTALLMVPLRKLLGFRKPKTEPTPQLRFGKPMRLED